jgi:membrane associated rhomboid family serine protease
MIEAWPPKADTPNTIPASSEREAMDWSLVVLSQGIESTVLHDAAEGRWQLLVGAQDMAAAQDSIRLYEQENRAWPLRQPLPWVGASFDWTAVGWVGLIAVFFALQTQPGSSLEAVGVSRAGLVRAGEWWRPITATLLHADLGHLALNAVFGLMLLGMAMGRFGSGISLAVTLVGGALANATPLLWREDWAGSLGASAVVMAALGLLAGDAIMQQIQRRQPRRLVIQALAGGVMLFVLMGTSPSSDIPAHASGFVAGVMFGIPLAGLPLTTLRCARGNLVAGFLYCALVSGAWIWGLSRPVG